MTNNDLPIVTMRDDELVPEGDYLAECTGFERTKNREYMKFSFRILNPNLEKCFVNGICELKENRSSSFIRWILALTGIEYKQGSELNLKDLQSMIVGNHCYIRIKHREKDDCVYDNVVAVYSHNDQLFLQPNQEDEK